MQAAQREYQLRSTIPAIQARRPPGGAATAHGGQRGALPPRTCHAWHNKLSGLAGDLTSSLDATSANLVVGFAAAAAAAGALGRLLRSMLARPSGRMRRAARLTTWMIGIYPQLPPGPPAKPREWAAGATPCTTSPPTGSCRHAAGRRQRRRAWGAARCPPPIEIATGSINAALCSPWGGQPACPRGVRLARWHTPSTGPSNIMSRSSPTHLFSHINQLPARRRPSCAPGTGLPPCAARCRCLPPSSSLPRLPIASPSTRARCTAR